MPNEELYIKDPLARQFGEEVDAHEDQGNHWEKKILNHLISRPNVLIEIQPVTILDLHDTCDVLNAYNLHDIVLGDGAKSLSLIRGTHNESVMFHGFSFGTYMEHETLKCFGRCIVHKRDKFKDYVHGLRISLLVHNFHRIHLAMKFVLVSKIQERKTFPFNIV